MQIFTFSRLWTYSCSLLFLFAVCCCSVKSDTLSDNVVLPEDDIAIGQKIDEAYLQHLDTVPDQQVLAEQDHPALYTYIYDLCNLIQNGGFATSISDPRHPVRKPIVRILEAPNKTGAFVAPGGYLYIYTGLLKALNHEAEIVPILAHLTNCSNKRFAVKKLEDHFSTNFLLDLAIGGNVNGSYASASANVCAVIDHLENKPYDSHQVKTLDNISEDVTCQLGYDVQIYATLYMTHHKSDLDWFQLFDRHMSNNDYASHLYNNVSDSLTCNGTKSSEGYPQFKALIP